MKKLLHLLQIFVFLLLLVCLLAGLSRIMAQKDSIIGLKPFLNDAEEYDVTGVPV